jgi:hypothetical protein
MRDYKNLKHCGSFFDACQISEIFMNWYLKVLKDFTDFKSRSRRKEYWMFVLFNFLAAMIIGIIMAIAHLPLIVINI